MKQKGKKPLKKFSKKNEKLEANSDLDQQSSSKIFTLQTDELIGKLQLDGQDTSFLTKWLKKFKQVISQLPEDSLDSCFYSAEYPLSFKPNINEKTFNLIFKQPKNIQLFGSHFHQTNLSTESAVDIALILPNEYFKRDDYLNHKMIHKIAAYLMYLKRKLVDCSLGCDLKIIKFKNDPSKPVLSITAEIFKILIHIFPTDDLFKASRFLPNINNIKENNGEPSIHPTPHYNYQISSYITRIQNENFLNNFYSVNKNLSIALRLLKMWVRQRKFDSGFYGFDGFILSCYLVHLMRIRKIQGDLSPYHIVRIFWNHFGNSSLDVNGISLNDKTDTSTLKSYDELYELVMIDSTGHCNLLSMISSELYERVKEDSLKSLKLMENPSPETFQKLFLTKIPHALQYDHVFVLKIDDKQSKTIIEKHAELSDQKNYHNFNYVAMRKLIVTVLKQGETFQI
jgi:U3 small nucleolar RNA-associated protein 22